MAKGKKKRLSEAKGKRQEKQFFMYAGVITLVLLVVVYLVFVKS